MSSSNSSGQIPLDAVHMATNSDQLLLVKDDQSRKRKLEIRVLESEPSDFSLDIQDHFSSPSPSDQQDQDHDSDDQESRLVALAVAKDFRDDEIAKTTSFSSSGSVEEPNVDGFRTPTGSDHKITAAARCPPAPRKPKPSPELRKVKSATVRRSLEVELSRREFEAMFPMSVNFCDPIYTLKFKRPRRD